MKKRKPPQADAVRAILNEAPSFTDPQGSWTGRPEEPDETPVQDADDL